MTGTELLAALGALLNQALDLTPDERETWLARLRIEQPAHAAELDALLAAEADLDSRGFLSGGPLVQPQALPGLAGQRLGAYTLERPLGHGGMGSVWLGRRSDGRYEGQVAVKLLNLALLDPVGSERFRREGSALARLTHPNIARLIDAGVTEGASDLGQPYLVLEYVDGVRIDRYCDERRLGPVERLALFQQVLASVAHAHANLIVHRDLKPSNILVTGDGTVKLLDFGIAKLLGVEGGSAERTELTDVGGAPLTPEYATPEQVTGGAITTATDVYALGVLLYLLLAGVHPTTSAGRAPADRLRGLLESEPPRLSAVIGDGAARAADDDVVQAAARRGASPQRLRRLYAGDLDNIVAKALRKEPSERYVTVTAFAEDIGRFLRDEPVLARPATFRYRAAKFLRRHRASVATGAAIAVALVVGTIVALTQAREARLQRDEARAQRDRAVFQEQRATASSGFLETLLQSVAPAGRPYTTVQLLGRARELLERDFRSDPRFVARMMIDLSAHYAAVDNVQEELGLLRRAVDLAVREGDAGTAALAECSIALLQAGREHAADARPSLASGLRPLPRASPPDIRSRMQCLLAQAQLAIADGPQDSALPLARRAVALAATAGDTSSVAYADALATVAVQFHNQNRVPEALAAMRQVIAALDRIGRGSTLPMLDALVDEARFLRDLGEMRSADSALSLAVRLAQRVDPRYVAAKISILAGEVSIGRARPDSAISAFEAALTEATRTGDAFRAQWALERLVQSLAARGSISEARARLAQLSAMIPEDDRASLGLLEALIAEATGDPGQAYRAYMHALMELGFPDDPHVPPWHRMVYRAARAALASGDPRAADSLARHAVRLEGELGHDVTRSSDIGLALVIQARARATRGDSAGAREALERAIGPLEYGLGREDARVREVRRLLAQGGHP